MEFQENGLRVWYETPDAPAPPNTVRAGTPLVLTLGVSPAHPSNTAEVRYRLDSGPELALRATLLRTEYAGGRQYFQAIFPYLAPGTAVEYGPLVRCAGRRAGVAPSGQLPSSFLVAPDSARPAAAAPVGDEHFTPEPFPRRMEYLARSEIQLARQPEVIGDTPDGLHLDFPLAGGAAQGPRLNGIYGQFGGDWMRVRTDGVGIPDIHATLHTTDGALIMVHASGRFDLGPDGYANASKGTYPPKPPLVLSIAFLSASPAYNWLNRTQCVGIGYVTMAELRVHYDVYGILSLCS
jgi:hypothetical protein